MTLNWSTYPRGIGKKERYNFIRNQRETFVLNEVAKLKKLGAATITEYPDYLILDNGDIYSTLNRKITKLKPGKKSNGYRFVGLTDKNGNRKYEMVHRLVCKAFIPCQCKNFSFEVNHKDGDLDNNHVDNLEWVTTKENAAHRVSVLKHHNRSQKLTVSDIESIYFDMRKYGDIAEHFGVSKQTVCNIKRQVGYKREFEILKNEGKL